MSGDYLDLSTRDSAFALREALLDEDRLSRISDFLSEQLAAGPVPAHDPGEVGSVAAEANRIERGESDVRRLDDMLHSPDAERATGLRDGHSRDLIDGG